MDLGMHIWHPLADDIIANLAKEREPGIEIIKRTPLSFIITSL